MKLKHKGNKTKIFKDEKKKLKQKSSWTYFELKAIPSMYTYVVWIQMNGEHSLRSEYVSTHSFVCIVFSLISFFPLNLHIFSVLRLFFFWIPLSGFSDGFTYATSNVITTVIYRIVHFKVQRYHFI